MFLSADWFTIWQTNMDIENLHVLLEKRSLYKFGVIFHIYVCLPDGEFSKERGSKLRPSLD